MTLKCKICGSKDLWTVSAYERVCIDPFACRDRKIAQRLGQEED